MTSPSKGRTAITRGANAHKLASEGRLAHGTASLADRPSFPSVEATRSFLDALMCPFCALGPFRYPLAHVSHMHGISAPEMRAYLGVPRMTSFSDPKTFQANQAKGIGAPNLDADARSKRGEQRRIKARECWEQFCRKWAESDRTDSTLRALMEQYGYKDVRHARRRLREAGQLDATAPILTMAAAAKAGFEFAEAEWKRLGLDGKASK